MTGSRVRDVDLSEVVCPPPQLPASFDRVVLPVDKDVGWTSFDVIRKLRRLVGVRKMGHAGTLDPLASGLLIVLVGRATKLMQPFLELPKVYEGAIRLGEVTPTYDAESEVTERLPIDHLTPDDLERARRKFVGTFRQEAPAFSAVKVGGERLYKKARRGEDVKPPLRVVTVSSFELLGRTGPDVAFRVECSKGTYVRSLAHEYGRELDVGGHLTALRRTAIGPFSVEDAWTIEQLSEALS